MPKRKSVKAKAVYYKNSKGKLTRITKRNSKPRGKDGKLLPYLDKFGRRINKKAKRVGIIEKVNPKLSGVGVKLQLKKARDRVVEYQSSFHELTGVKHIDDLRKLSKKYKRRKDQPVLASLIIDGKAKNKHIVRDWKTGKIIQDATPTSRYRDQQYSTRTTDISSKDGIDYLLSEINRLGQKYDIKVISSIRVRIVHRT